MKNTILLLIFALLFASLSHAQDSVTTTSTEIETTVVSDTESVEEAEAETETETELVGSYEDVDPQDWYNIEYQEFLNIGANKIIRIAIQNNKIASSNNAWRVTAINSIETQVVSGTNYRFNISLINEDNTTVIRTTFVVYNQPWTNYTLMTKWYYIVLPQYVPLKPLSLVNTDRVINALMVYGANQVVLAGQEDGKIPEDESFTPKTLSAARVRFYYPDLYNYVFTVGMKSDDNATVKATYRVDYNTTLDGARLNGYSFVYSP